MSNSVRIEHVRNLETQLGPLAIGKSSPLATINWKEELHRDQSGHVDY